jgi:hypothetical protein
VDDLLPATTVNLALQILTALTQHKPAFYTRFKKDGGVRMLERILPSFCTHAHIFYTLLCLLLGKPMQVCTFLFFLFYFHFIFCYCLFTRFKKDGGVRMLERILPSFCTHVHIFYTLLCLLLGKPMQVRTFFYFLFGCLFFFSFLHPFKKYCGVRIL